MDFRFAMNMPPKTLKIPTIIAHRGLSSEAPENTMAAFSLAVDQGLKWLEVDVKMTLDGIYLICHDENLERTTNGTGRISESNWDQLSKLDAGSWFNQKYSAETLPKLENVLLFCKKHQIGINLELKPVVNNLSEFNHNLIPIIQRYRELGIEILVSSFNKLMIIDIHNQAPDIPLGYLVDETDSKVKVQNFIKDKNILSIHLPEPKSTKKLITELQKFKKIILVYTVNDKTRSEELFSWGVDGVFSDYDLM